MKKNTKKLALLIMAVMFTTFGISLSNNEAFADETENTITVKQWVGTPTTYEYKIFKVPEIAGNGGAIDVHSSLKVSISDFIGNSAQQGGAIFNDNIAEIIGSTFKNNKAGKNGGAINNNGEITITDSTFENNEAGERGGAIDNGRDLEITSSTFSNNSAKKGGAIYHVGGDSLKVKDSEFRGNHAEESGGAIYNGGNAVITNTTFTDNTANGEKNDIHNVGSLELNGEVNFDGGITNGGRGYSSGTTTISSDSTVNNQNGSLIQGQVSIGTGANLITDFSKMSVTNGITNNGTVTLVGTAGEFGEYTKFSGNGSIVLDVKDGTFTLNDSSLIADTINITVNQGQFKIGSKVNNINNKLAFNDGTTLNILNNAKNTVKDLNNSGSESELKLMLDFDDKIDTLDGTTIGANNSISLEKINLNNITNTNTTSTISDTLGDIINIALDAEIIDDSNTYNYVTLNKNGSGSAELKASASNLNSAIQDNASQRTYQMKGSEAIDSNNNAITGILVVNGHGNTISSSDSNYGSISIGGVSGNSELSLVDANINNFKLKDSDKGAFTIKDGGELSIVAKNNDVAIKNITGGDSNAIYLDSTSGDATAYIIAQNSVRTVTIDNAIRSNSEDNTINLGGNGKIILNGILDPVTVVQYAQNVYRNNYDEAVNWELNSGTVHYSNDKYLYNSAYHNDATLNSINLNGGSLDLMNGVASDIKLANLQVGTNSNLYLDVDLANEKMDRFSDDTSVTTSANINVAGLNLISDAVKNYTSINFTNNTDLMGHVSYTGSQGLTALSPIYKYNVDYDETTGNFGFTRAGSGYSGHNPSIYAGAVGAQVGSYLGQLNVYEQSFANMDMLMLMSREQRTAMKYANKYATSTNNLIYDETNQIPEQAKGAWFRPYATFENVGLKGGVDVGNVAYGSLFGGDTNIIELGHGWDAVITPFIGYLGSHQTYDGVGIYQNGGVLGLSSAFYKGNFFTGLTANAGANVGEASTMYGTDTFTMLTAGIASKTGYNWELAKGKFIIQPSLLMSYTFVNTFDYKTASGVNMNSDPIHGIQITPGLKFIGNLKNGWQPYLAVQMVWNIMDKTRFQANDVSLEQLSVKPYVQYGLGVQKRLGERFTGYTQAMIRNGGRNGIALSAGFRWTLGK